MSKLKDILKLQSVSYNQWRVFAYVVRELKGMGCNYYTFNGCIYVTKGEADNYPCIVAHMDTVYNFVEDLTLIEVDGSITGLNKVTMSQTGIGGDDKIGVYIALQCLRDVDNIKAVFFRDEETGCEGSYNNDKEFFDNCGFVLQCDRRGNNDFVTSAGGTQLASNEFQNDVAPILKRRRYQLAHGMMTDVMALKETGIECSMANISCGYYNPHTNQEYVNIQDVENCLRMVMEIITKLGGKQYLFKTKKQTVYDDYYWVDNKKGTTQFCDCCGEYEALEYVSEYNIEMCIKCVQQYVGYRR